MRRAKSPLPLRKVRIRSRGQGSAAARDDGQQRIAKLLARAGIASRREIERMIEDGRIALNGVKSDHTGDAARQS